MNSADIPQTFRIFLRLKLTHTQTYRNTVQYSSRRNEDEEVDRRRQRQSISKAARILSAVKIILIRSLHPAKVPNCYRLY